MSSVSSGDADLKQQFELLQHQQQKKLMRRKQREDEKNKEKGQLADSTASPAFGVDDNLGLKMQEKPAESIYSEELVLLLNEQIRELKDETGRLYKLLSERDFELRQLRKKRDEDKAVMAVTGGITSETASSKIVELSKKVRELTSDLEKEKTKSRQLAKKCVDLETEIQKVSTGEDKKPSRNTNSMFKSAEAQENEIHVLQDKLHHTELRMAELRNQWQAMKQELKLAQKVIFQEVGEGVNIAGLINAGGNWRGRAQQIVALQKKVNDLKYQLGRQPPINAADRRDLEEEMTGSSSRVNAEERHREQIRKMEKERKEGQEKIALEMKALEADYHSSKQKLDASKARNKVLMNEVKYLKQQVQVLLDKGKHDDELVEALLKQQNQLKTAIEDSSRKHLELDQISQETRKQLSQKTQQDNNIVEQLKAIVAEREAKVKVLEEEVKQIKLESVQKSQMDVMGEIFSSSRPATANRSPLGSRGSPDQQSLTIEDITSLSPGPPSSRPPSRKKSARPDSSRVNLDELMDLRQHCQEYKSVSQAAEVERDKLSELVQLLQKRIDESTAKVTQAQIELMAEKRRNVEMEKKLGKFKVEQGHSAKRSAKAKVKASNPDLQDEDTSLSGADLEELQTRLAIQQDENEALKAALQSTLKAKEDDLKLYNDMIEQTKSVFLQGLRQHRQGQTPS